MKTEYINSYYSEIDYINDYYNGIDGLYAVTYPDDMDLHKEVAEAYQEMQDNDELTNELSVILDYLKDKKKACIEYKVIECTKFDCDYGKFKDE